MTKKNTDKQKQVKQPKNVSTNPNHKENFMVVLSKAAVGKSKPGSK